VSYKKISKLKKEMKQQDFDIHRPVFKFKNFEKDFEKPLNESEEKRINGNQKEESRLYKCLTYLTGIFKIFSIIDVIKYYQFKKSLISDIISGIIVGIAIIPSALAFGSLTSLPAIHGIYTAMFSS
jgi:hypothetical protein